MLIAISALKGFPVEASDGKIGTVGDFLFDDVTWKVRWLVVDTGRWLTGRKVLVHPSSLGKPDYEADALPVALTKAQVEASPPILEHQPVSSQMEARLYTYYGSDPVWGDGYFGASALAAPVWSPDYLGGVAAGGIIDDQSETGDPHLRSVSEVEGYHIHATDGEIGHAENFLIEDRSWEIRYIVVDTRNWWPGKHVLISPFAVPAISWSDREIKLDLDRDRVRSSPPWNPIAMIDEVYEKQLHRHYGWPGYGF